MVRTSTLIVLIAVLAAGFACSQRRDHASANHGFSSPRIEGSVNINTASADELEKLPNIGRKTAEAIVEFRSVNGPFRRAEHIMQIRGISEKRFLEMRAFLRTD